MLECEMAKVGLFYTSDVAALQARQWRGLGKDS